MKRLEQQLADLTDLNALAFPWRRIKYASAFICTGLDCPRAVIDGAR
jgi:hypothetical protein